MRQYLSAPALRGTRCAEEAHPTIICLDRLLGLVVVGEQRKRLDGVLGLLPKGALEIRENIATLGNPLAHAFLAVSYDDVAHDARHIRVVDDGVFWHPIIGPDIPQRRYGVGIREETRITE